MYLTQAARHDAKPGVGAPEWWLFNGANSMSIQESHPLSSVGTQVANSNVSGMSLDDILDILSNPRRRYTIEHLTHANGELSFAELVDRVAEAEFGKSIDAISTTERNRIRTSLYQTHLPALEEAGVVDYQRRSGDIATGANARVMVDYLDRLESPTIAQRIRSSVSHAVALL